MDLQIYEDGCKNVLPAYWKYTTLGEVADYLNGRAFKPKEWKEKGLPIIRIQNLNKEDAPYNYSDEIFEEKYLVKQGELLFAWSASLGAYIWKGKDAWLNQHIFKVIPKIFVHKLYLYYYLDKVTKELYAKAHGSGMVHVTKKKFEATSIALPPLHEQRAIVSKIEQLFSELDNGIANLKLAQAQLKVYRQAVLKKAFEGELTREWREQQTDLPYAKDLLEQIRVEREESYNTKMDEWKKAVKEWEDAGKEGKKPTKPRKSKGNEPLTENELAELSSLSEAWRWTKIGLLTLGVEYGTSTKSQKSGQVPVLRMGNIQNGKFDWEDLVYTSDKAEIEKYLLKKDDVLFNRTNSPELVGKTAIYKGEMPAIFAGYLIRVNQLHKFVVAAYLNYFLNCHTAKMHGNSVKTDGVNQSNINGEKLSNYPFPLCSLLEQQAIVTEIETRLSVCDKVEQDIEENLKIAEALRQSILKRAFEGKLLNERELEEVRSAPDWEPAEVLLEKIRVEKAGSGKKGRA